MFKRKKKKKFGEAYKNDDLNVRDSGKQKPCKLKSWVWDHFTIEVSGTRAKCN